MNLFTSFIYLPTNLDVSSVNPLKYPKSNLVKIWLNFFIKRK